MERMTNCRACKRTNLFMSLPLGDHPPANGFLRASQLSQPEARFPLNTHVCLDCGLIQVPEGGFQLAVWLPDDFLGENKRPTVPTQTRDHLEFGSFRLAFIQLTKELVAGPTQRE